jgi:hypothetical protein
LSLRGFRQPVLQLNARSQFIESKLVDFAVELHPIGLLLSGERVLQPAVVSQNNQTFGIEIQAASRIDIGRANEIRQRRPAFGIGELTENAVRLVKKQRHRR